MQYAESLGIYEGATGQGFTVHHATGWYLNFGTWGLIAGALLVGIIWAECYNAHNRVRRGDRHWAAVLAIVAPAGFVLFSFRRWCGRDPRPIRAWLSKPS